MRSTSMLVGGFFIFVGIVFLIISLVKIKKDSTSKDTPIAASVALIFAGVIMILAQFQTVM